MAEGLRGGGLRVEEYQTAREFLIDKVNHQGGVVVASVRLMELGGIELANTLKGEAKAFPVILMAGHADSPAAVKSGVDFVDDLNPVAVHCPAAIGLVSAGVTVRRKAIKLNRCLRHKDYPREFKMLRSFLIALIYCLFWNSVSTSQVSIRSAYNESATEALTKGDYEKAEKLYRLAIKEAESINVPDDTQIATILGLASILSDTDRNPEAGQILDSALNALEKRVPASDTDEPDEPDEMFYSNLRETLASRTRVHLLENEFEKAKSHYQHWASLLEKRFNSRFDFTLAYLLEDYSRLCEENGDFSEVEEIYKRWITTAAAENTPRLYDVAQIRMQLAKHYSDSGQNAKAETVYKDLLEKLEKGGEKYLSEISDVLKSLSDIYADDERFLEAEAVLKKLLKVEENSKSDLGMARALEGLADVYITQSKYSDAESLLQRSLSLSAKTFKDYANSIIDANLKIAQCQSLQGNQKQAEEHYEDVLASLEKRFQEKQKDVQMVFLLPEALRSVAAFYEQNDRPADVELLLNQWIERIEQSPKPDQSLRFAVLGMLANFYQSHDRGMEAENLYKKRLDKEPDNSAVGKLARHAIRINLAMVHLQNQNFESAASEMKDLVDLQGSISRFDKHRQAQLKYVLATVLEIQGERVDALRTEQEAIKMLRKHNRRVNVRISVEEESAADECFNEGDFREAEVRYSSAILAALLAIQDDPKALRRLNEKLGRTVAAQKRNKEADVYFRRAQRFPDAK